MKKGNQIYLYGIERVLHKKIKGTVIFTNPLKVELEGYESTFPTRDQSSSHPRLIGLLQLQ